MLKRTLALLLVSLSAHSLPAPEYLSVPHWRECAEVITRCSTDYVCLPVERPVECPLSSWLTLINEDMLDPCE